MVSDDEVNIISINNWIGVDNLFSKYNPGSGHPTLRGILCPAMWLTGGNERNGEEN